MVGAGGAGRAGRMAVVLVAFLGLLAGLAIGRWGPGRKVERSETWREVDELHQMYLVPSSYNFVETNKSYESQLHRPYPRPAPALRPRPERARARPGEDLRSVARRPDLDVPPPRGPDARRGQARAPTTWSSRSTSAWTRGSTARSAATSSSTSKPIEADGDRPAHRHVPPGRAVPLVPLGDRRGLRSCRRRRSAGSPATRRSSVRAVGVQQPELKYLRGFGPYFVESPDTQEVRLVRNDKFWGRGDEQAPRPLAAEDHAGHAQEDVTAELDFVRDDRFLYRPVGPMEAERLRDDPDFQILDRGRGGGCFFFWVNQNPRCPVGARRIPGGWRCSRTSRSAARWRMRIDRNAIIRRAFKGYAEPLYGPVSPIFRWAAPSEVLQEVTPKTDPAAALAELAKPGRHARRARRRRQAMADLRGGGKRVPLEIEIRTSKDEEDRRRKTAEEIKAQLEAIGVRVKVVEERFGDMVHAAGQDLRLRGGRDGPGGDAGRRRAPLLLRELRADALRQSRTRSPPRPTGRRRVDELYQVYATSPDVAVRDRAILDVQKTWVAAQPAFHLVNDRKLVAVRRRLRGQRPGPHRPGDRPDPAADGHRERRACGDWCAR